jgi:hypothetical protein
MRRKLWTSVLATVALLALAGNLPGRLPASWLDAASALWAGVVARTPVLWASVLVAAAALREGLVARLPDLVAVLQTPAYAVGAAAFLAALAGALFTLALGCRRRDPFKAAVREARGGRPLARVARRTRLAQDAVRTLLHPDRAQRRRSRRRREEPSVPAGLTPWKGRGRKPAAGQMRWVESS